MAKIKALSQAEKDYNKELRRIKAFIRRASKRGYTFDDSIIPKRPKRVTKASVDKLKKITPNTLYKKAEFLNPQTGDIMKGPEGRKFERRLVSYKGKLTKSINAAKNKNKKAQKVELPSQGYTILNNVRETINTWSPSSIWSRYWVGVKENDKNKLVAMLDNAVDTEGVNTVARRLQLRADDIERIVNSILYGSNVEQVQFDLVNFATIILGRSLSVEESAELTDLQEGQENFTQ